MYETIIFKCLPNRDWVHEMLSQFKMKIKRKCTLWQYLKIPRTIFIKIHSVVERYLVVELNPFN